MSIEKPKIGVYAIMKDESIEQVQGWAQSIMAADRTILVDTGSKDASVQHLASHIISVQPFRFDVARNAALSLMPAGLDICISLDLDERLTDGWREALEAAWVDNPTRAVRYAVTYLTPGLAPFTHNSRVHSRHGFMWKEPCHEAIYSWMQAEQTVDAGAVVIDHKPDRSKDRSSYLSLLAHGVNEEPWNSRRMFYYARELMTHQHFEKALGWFNQYLKNWEADPDHEINWEVEQAQAYALICEGAIKELSGHDLAKRR